MLEARVFVKEIESAKKILEENQAIFKGQYKCRDIIFFPKDLTKKLKWLLMKILKKYIKKAAPKTLGRP